MEEESKPGTKTRIFNAALRLFATRGVENASTRDIATEAGINIASIYNYYESKDQIVDACYDLYLDYHDINKPNEEQYTQILLTGTKEEVVNVPNFQFPEEMEQNLIYAMTVLFSKIYTDVRASEKYSRIVERSMVFLQDFLGKGIEIGRFERFNVRIVSMLFLSARLFAAQSTTLHPKTLRDFGFDQLEIMKELINNIPFKY